MAEYRNLRYQCHMAYCVLYMYTVYTIYYYTCILYTQYYVRMESIWSTDLRKIHQIWWCPVYNFPSSVDNLGSHILVKTTAWSVEKNDGQSHQNDCHGPCFASTKHTMHKSKQLASRARKSDSAQCPFRSNWDKCVI